MRLIAAPELLAVIDALIFRSPAAFRVRVVGAFQVSGAESVMSPASLPLEPVVTLTLAVLSVELSVAMLMFAPEPVAAKPDWLLFARDEIVRS